jgi:hypothetical protein
VPAPAIRLADVRPHTSGAQREHRLIVVIPLVGDELGERRRLRAGGVGGLHLVGRGQGGVAEAARVAAVGAVQPQARQMLRKLMAGKIAMDPVAEGRQRGYRTRRPCHRAPPDL